MWNAKRVAVAALAALMIAGAVPALASEEASEDITTRQETVAENAKRARKHRKSATTETEPDDGDTSAKPSRKPARQSATTETETDDSDTSARPSRKPARQSADSGDSTASARPSRKPDRKPDRNPVTDNGDTPAESETV